MIHKISITKALVYLYSIVSEPSVSLKRYSIKANFKKSNHNGLLDIVLSNYFDKVVPNTFTPRFNTIAYTDLKQDILSYVLSTDKRRTFYKLPFLSQQMLHLMTDVSKIGLTLQDLTKIKFKYIVIKDWLDLSNIEEVQ